MKFTVRRCSEQTAHALWNLISPEDEWPEQDAHWAAYWQDTPVGFASASLIGEDTVYLSSSGVLPAFRGQGLQRRMIRARINWAKKQERPYIITYTVAKNYPSMINLLKAGFKFYTPQYQWAGKDSHYYIKQT